MFHKFVRAVNILQAGETYLGDNRAELATGGGNAVSGRTVTSGKGLSRNDERGGVRTKVLEEVGQTVEEHKRLLGRSGVSQFVVTEA